MKISPRHWMQCVTCGFIVYYFTLLWSSGVNEQSSAQSVRTTISCLSSPVIIRCPSFNSDSGSDKAENCRFLVWNFWADPSDAVYYLQTQCRERWTVTSNNTSSTKRSQVINVKYLLLDTTQEVNNRNNRSGEVWRRLFTEFLPCKTCL